MTVRHYIDPGSPNCRCVEITFEVDGVSMRSVASGGCVMVIEPCGPNVFCGLADVLVRPGVCVGDWDEEAVASHRENPE